MDNTAGVVAVIGAILTPVTVIVVAWFNHRRIEAVRVQGEETLRIATVVDRAVNGKSAGDTTLSEDVVRIRDKQEADQPTLSAADRQASSEALLPLVKRLVEAVDQMGARIDAVAARRAPTRKEEK